MNTISTMLLTDLTSCEW